VEPWKGEILTRVLGAVAQLVSGPDPYMTGHAVRVADYCDRVGRLSGLSDDDRFLLRLTAQMHDIGMLSTPSHILRKPSALAEEEMEEVRIHPVKGFELFVGEARLEGMAHAIRHHHERFDGSGYPDGLRGEGIPFFARIILVADTYEAMTHHRPYRRAMTHAEALRRIQDEAGRQFDPEVVRHFVAVIEADLGS
jgi:HD-GYP domain-containing protein (c-di-GMP phosphodiesterase class II)